MKTSLIRFYKTVLLIGSLILIINFSILAQGVSVNISGAAADNSAMLDVSSTSMGMLVPRMTETQKNAIVNPATGLLIYQIDNSTGFWYYNGTSWMQSVGLQGPIGPTGPVGCADANYIVKSNGTNAECSQIYDNGTNVGVGTNYPNQKLDVNGNINIAYNKDFMINNNRMLSSKGDFNLFVGENAGISNVSNGSSGDRNVFLGFNSGYQNISGRFNSFVGAFAGMANTTGNDNSLFGIAAGTSNTEGYSNTFLGSAAGFYNISGYENSFVGYRAGYMNNVGYNNVFLGANAGHENSSGHDNCFIGNLAGEQNTSGSNNIFIGTNTGDRNTTNGNNTFVGHFSGFFNTADNNSFLGYHAGYINTTGGNNSFFGNNSGSNNLTGANNSFFGDGSGYSNNTGNNNTCIGTNSGQSNAVGNNNTFIGYNADGDWNLTNASAIGANANVTTNNSLVLGNAANVGIGTSSPTRKLDVNGNARIGTNGTTITNIIKATVTVDLPNVGAGAYVKQSFAVAGATTNSTAYISPFSELNDGLIICYVRVSAANTVEVKFRNLSLSGINMASMNWYITVIE